MVATASVGRETLKKFPGGDKYWRERGRGGGWNQNKNQQQKTNPDNSPPLSTFPAQTSLPLLPFTPTGLLRFLSSLLVLRTPEGPRGTATVQPSFLPHRVSHYSLHTPDTYFATAFWEPEFPKLNTNILHIKADICMSKISTFSSSPTLGHEDVWARRCEPHTPQGSSICRTSPTCTGLVVVVDFSCIPNVLIFFQANIDLST